LASPAVQFCHLNNEDQADTLEGMC
jgi:hypothetical protein